MEHITDQRLSVGIIMDGNRRWAKANNLPSFEGHRRGYEKLRELIKWATEANIGYVTVYAFSTENWKRSSEEVGYLMQLLGEAVRKVGDEAAKNDIRVIFIGETTQLSASMISAMRAVEATTKDCKTLTLAIALSYGGRNEIIDAIKRIPLEQRATLTETDFSKLLWTHDIKDPDIIIRPGGEQRLSNFLTWQSVYSELFFAKSFWPDFSKDEFLAIIEDFNGRERRLGK